MSMPEISKTHKQRISNGFQAILEHLAQVSLEFVGTLLLVKQESNRLASSFFLSLTRLTFTRLTSSRPLG